MYSRIELWTNDSESEFAVIEKSDVLAKPAESNFRVLINNPLTETKFIIGI